MTQPETSVVCSCGVEGCRELGWPHEWDPIAANDHCAAQPLPPHQILTIDGDYSTGLIVTNHTGLHRVTEPYVRWGSGYACAECAQ